ncbi:MULTISPECIES: glycosyltransferase [unclassified Micromonospora]|uniref:glycosyltransferase n=1 Tax=unclassified Micromonospora TaxID=2617518 RepID=UPI003A8BE6C3
MRAVHFTDTYLPRRDGVVTSLRTLAAASAAAGHPGLIVVPRHPDQPTEADVLRLRALPCGVADLRLSPWLLRGAAATGTIAEIAAHAPDVVHVHTPGPVGLLGVLTARRLGLPLVQTYHTDLHAYADAYRVPARALSAGVRLYARRLGVPRPAAAPAGHARDHRPMASGAVARRRAAMDATNTLLLGGADAVVVPTRAVLDRIHLPVPANRVHLVPTGVAARRTTADEINAFRYGHGITPSDRVVLYVGRINREKGIDLLITAFERVLVGCPTARLVLVGALYEPRWLAALLRTIDPRVAARITLTGQQGPDVVAAAYGAAEVFAFASQTDTQALVLQEAGLAGVPVVLVDRALHAHGALAGAALRTQPQPGALASGVLRLLLDPDTARRRAAAAAARCAEHTPARYAEAIREVYASAAGLASRFNDRGRTRR